MPMKDIISLHGFWKRFFAGRPVDFVKVPGSYPPVGECELEFEFDCPESFESAGSRIFLCADGVLSSAQFSINGVSLGTAGSSVPYRFELPKNLLRSKNVIRALVKDINENFGFTPGRKFEGGIYRPIYIEKRPSSFIENIAFRYELDKDCSAVSCVLHVNIDGGDEISFSCELIDKESGKVEFECGTKKGNSLAFKIESPSLWSPERPDLCILKVGLANGDSCEEIVGFRRIEVSDSDFYLNGKRLLLKGVCRHEFSEDCGYAVPEENARYELLSIKHSGFNYVRLVHHPQAQWISRIAAEIGLLVSEEPGPCFQDLSDEKIAAPALESLRRLILRDRNCPSVFAWLIYNECDPDISYAVRAGILCHELDPGRFVSMADCSGKNDKIKKMAEVAGLSFYGINIYGTVHNIFVERMAILTDRPFVLTEWGGGFTQGNPHTLKYLCKSLVECTRSENSPHLAGFAFWVWADYEERSRGDIICSPEGYTIEGLVDIKGNPKEDLAVISQMCFEMDHYSPVVPPRIEVLARGMEIDGSWSPVSLAGIDGDQTHLEKEILNSRFIRNQRNNVDYHTRIPHFAKLAVGGIEFRCRDEFGLFPILIGPGREVVEIPIGRRLSSVAFLGHVALRGGYPSIGGGVKLGEEASEYEFIFEDGSVTQPLLHGVQILRSNNIAHWFMCSPRSPESLPAVKSLLDPSYEEIRFDFWKKDFAAMRFLREIRWRLKDPNTVQALLAVSVNLT